MVARDIALVRLTGAPVHFLHLSTAGSVDLVRRAKEEGLPVTAEAAPHHMLLTHAAVAGYDPVFKVNPPLRTDEDVAAVVAGLCDGTIDAVATDHAPHAPESKDVPFDQAPPGMLGLQTALPIAWEVLSPHLGPERVFALLSAQPAVIAKLTATDPRRAGHSAHGGPVEVGGDGQPVRLRPRRHDGGGPGGAGQPQPQHAVRRPHLRRSGAPHRAAGRGGRDRRDGATVSARSRPAAATGPPRSS